MGDVDPARIGFRGLREEDLPLMYRWLNTPEVGRWYGEALPLHGIVRKYGPRVRGEVPTRPFAILYEGQPVGYVQTYRIADWPEYAAQVAVEQTAAGVDLFIGEPSLQHRGLGTAFLKRFLREVVFADPAIASCVLGPDPRNAAAIRCYEKAGFRYLKTVRVRDEPGPEYLMRVGREEIL